MEFRPDIASRVKTTQINMNHYIILCNKVECQSIKCSQYIQKHRVEYLLSS